MSIHCESKWKNKIGKLEKVYGRIPILGLSRSKSKKPRNRDVNRERYVVFQPGLILDLKIVEKFSGGYKLNCDQLVNMEHTQLTRQKSKDNLDKKLEHFIRK